MWVEPGPAAAPVVLPPPAVPVPVAPPATPSVSPGPWIVGGIGVASLLVGAVTGGLVLRDKSANDAGCSPVTKTCTPDAKQAGDAGRSLGPVTTATLIVGVAGVAGGALWLGLRKSGQASTGIGVGPVVGGAALRMEGSW